MDKLGLACCLVMIAGAVGGCSASDTLSVAPKGKGGSSAGGSTGAAGSTSAGGGGGASTTGGGGSTAAGGNPNSTGGGGGGSSGAGGTSIDMGSDAAADASPEASMGMDAPADVPPPLQCDGAAACIKMTLVHRYSFNGTGTTATDSVGTANGTVMNGQLTGTGDLVLAGVVPDSGMPAAYVDLPNGLVSKLSSATFEAWVTWTGGQGWQRLFDFGNSDQAENVQGAASTTLYFTPQAGGPTVMLAAFKRADQSYQVETRAQSASGLETGVKSHIALVVDPAHTLMTIYRNGMPDGSVLFTDSLSLLNDVNNWLGHSQYAGDPPFTGTLHEFRIYNAALPPDVILSSFMAGADAAY